jgi:hypothetical protein
LIRDKKVFLTLSEVKLFDSILKFFSLKRPDEKDKMKRPDDDHHHRRYFLRLLSEELFGFSKMKRHSGSEDG